VTDVLSTRPEAYSLSKNMFACGQGVEDVTDVSFHKGPCTGTENAYSSAYSTCSLFADTRHHLLGKSATAKTDCGVCEETVQGLILECGKLHKLETNQRSIGTVWTKLKSNAGKPSSRLLSQNTHSLT